MDTRGRKRKLNKNIPPHINQTLLPSNCYWDNSGRGYWYARHKDLTGIHRATRIAGRTATLSELHKAIEEFNGIERDTFAWLSQLFMDSDEFKELSLSSRTDYKYCSKIICSHPTKTYKLLGDIGVESWDSPLVQRLLDQLSKARGKSSANHAVRYIKRLFTWGKNRGYAKINPATGVEMAKEKPPQQLVTDEVYFRFLAYAKHCGSMKPKTAGSAPDYIWMVMELAYLCRLRGIEIVTMTEDSFLSDGLVCKRVKGSRDNITILNKRLKVALNAAISRRNKIWEASKYPVPLKIENRPLIVNVSGDALKKSTFDSAWQRLVVRAIKDNVISEEERFAPHDLKRKGITETAGNRADKKEASGHKSDASLDVYDKSIARVDPANN